MQIRDLYAAAPERYYLACWPIAHLEILWKISELLQRTGIIFLAIQIKSQHFEVSNLETGFLELPESSNTGTRNTMEIPITIVIVAKKGHEKPCANEALSKCRLRTSYFFSVYRKRCDRNPDIS